jgi:hypothetical protein
MTDVNFLDHAIGVTRLLPATKTKLLKASKDGNVRTA